MRQPDDSNGVDFGPLNGVRLALVVGAVIAAIVAGALGYWTAALVLILAVAAHGLGWLYLARHPHRR